MKLAYISKWFFITTLVLFAFSWFYKDRWPAEGEIVEDILRDPVQAETSKMPFSIEHKNKNYVITPKFDYELWGLVVSCHEASNPFDYYHKEWGDDLNAKDICVVWGENVESGIFRDVKFSSGSWTCYYSCKNRDWREILTKFRNDQLSNNHLLAASAILSNQLRRVRRGDQVYLKGYLAEYSHSNGTFHRGTSTCRTDSGNGACETIFVTDFKMLRQANPLWRGIYPWSSIFIIVSLVFWFMSSLKSKQEQCADES